MAVIRATAVALQHKLKRLTTSLQPVAENRRGECNRCGECCKLPFPCPFLRYDDEGLSMCAVYHARPPSCRKYPRIASENVTPETCGYYFVGVEEIGGRGAAPAFDQASPEAASEQAG